MTNPAQVYSFGQPTDQMDAALDVVGGKGWHLIRMAAVGLPVPPGFLFGTDLCQRFFAGGLDAQYQQRGDQWDADRHRQFRFHGARARQRGIEQYIGSVEY